MYKVKNKASCLWELMNSLNRQVLHSRWLKSAASVLLVNVWKGESARCHYKAIFVCSWGGFYSKIMKVCSDLPHELGK